jgi:hypothetical protein
MRKENRYLIVAKTSDGKIHSNKIPITDLDSAKKQALQNVNIQNMININGIKLVYADVPVSDVINGTHYEMQCIASNALSAEELNNDSVQ